MTEVLLFDHAHLFADSSASDYDPHSAALLKQRALSLLDAAA